MLVAGNILTGYYFQLPYSMCGVWGSLVVKALRY